MLKLLHTKRKVVKMTTLTLEQKINKAAHLIAEGKLVSFRGASADTYIKVEALAKKIKQEKEFPQCPCEECI
jgi:ATP-dependent protease HslVU (ClpYQ) peptidase subunit